MAKDLWYNKIDRNVDWGGDESTNNLPVAGSVVQEFIKSELNEKIGVIYHDGLLSRYLCFANEDDKNAYLNDNSLEHLIIASFVAPSSYVAKVKVDTVYKAVLINSKENYLTFNYEITNSGEIYADNIRYVVTITKNGNSSTINGTGIYGKEVTINLDEYFTIEGTTEVSIFIEGQTTGVTATAVVTYEVVNLEFTSDCDVSKVYDLRNEIIDPLVINYSIFGSSIIKYIEWYIDGKHLETDTIQGGTADVIVDNKKISVIGMEHGVHNIQYRAYVVVNGENFYTDTLYNEFMVVTEESSDPMIAIETVIPKEYGVTNNIKLYNVVQYELYSFNYGVYNPKNLEYIPIEIYVDGALNTTVNASNSKELTFSFTSNTSGNKEIKFKYNDYEKIVSADVLETVMDLQEVVNNLTLSLSASGRTNQDANRDKWEFGDYKTTFTGFNWSAASGWNDNRLVISNGMSIETDIKPLLVTNFGKTIEVEFETSNVTNDDAIVCNIMNDRGLGLLITASKATLKVGYGDKESVSSNFKANENVRISFVLDTTNRLAIIYVNGIMSGAVTMTSSISIDKYLRFTGTDEAGINIKQIRIYDTQLSSEQVLNNYILYRDTIAEMKALYSKNDILDGGLISIEKVSNYIPVILLTGEQIFWLETQKSTDTEIEIDVEYINKQDPEHQFKFYGGCCRIQGTSSAGYVRKNWRIYSRRKDKYISEAYDWQGNLITDEKRRISFKEGAVPVNCWTLKADFAESSGTHNTGISTLWNSVMYNANNGSEYICRTEAQKAAIKNGYEYDCRTTVDGFPIVVFARRNDKEEYTFMGKYNFNNDKSTENVFGFCDIPGFDDTYIPGHENELIPEGEFHAGEPYTYGNKMQCWEVKENADNYALFKTTEGWYDVVVNNDGTKSIGWTSGFEARYPDDGDEADTSDLKAFADWIISCDQEKFANEKKDHLDLWKIAAYYVYLYRFGAVDQVVKNSMFTSEDGAHWYFINYDNDTVLGLDNSGNIAYPPTITRETPSGKDYAYAGHESKLWNMLENDNDFITTYVTVVDNALFSGGLTYEKALQYFNVNQSDKWCELIYNEDANYKYVKPYISGLVDELPKMHGSRKSHRTWWLSKRFKLMDAKFNNSNYKGQHIQLKLEGSPGAEIKIKAGDYMYFGSEYNTNPWVMGVELNKGDEYVFYKPSEDEGGKDFVQGDPIYIYAPAYIEELDLSKVSEYIYQLYFDNIKDSVMSPMMKKLIIGGKKTAKEITTLSGLNNLINLEYLDLTGVYRSKIDISNLLLLKTLILTDSTINELVLPEGCMIEDLYISESLKTIKLNSLANLTLDNIHGFDTYHVSSIEIHNSPALTNSFNFYYNWLNKAERDDVLTLTGINWTEVYPSQLIKFKDFVDNGGKLSLKGKIEIFDPTIDQVEILQGLFGENCFTNNAELWIVAPESLFIHGPNEMRSGDSQIFTTTIFSENPGVVTWEIESGAEWVESIVSNSDGSGILTTIEDENEDHIIVLKAVHDPKDETTYVRWTLHEVVSKKVIYATSGSIIGDATIKKDTKLALSLLPNDFNGDYSTKWSIISNSYNDGNIGLSNQTNNSVIVTYINSVIFDTGTLIADVTNNNGTTFRIELPITITNDLVLMTSTSNPEVIAICYAQGWCKSQDVMYKEEAQKVTGIGRAFEASNIKSFDEFEEFRGISIIPTQAFQRCTSLKSIKLPERIEKIEGFSLGTTALSEIHIPSGVSSIQGSAFNSTPIVNFSVSESNMDYLTKDGVLVTSSGMLVKYPEGRTIEEYTTDPFITKLGGYSLSGTSLKKLILSDNVISHEVSCIVDNPYLTDIHFGANISPTDLAFNTKRNSALLNITVSENHQSLSSEDGVLYNIDKTIVWKYPEGRTSFITIDSAKTVGPYACYMMANLKEITLPDNIETLDTSSFYSCYNMTSFITNNTSNLKVIGKNALQLASAMKYIILPASLTSLNSDSFTSCRSLGSITFNGLTAPIFADITASNPITSAFGSSASNFTGLESSVRVVYIPTDSTGYDSDDWNNSIFSPDRNNFTLSKTL